MLTFGSLDVNLENPQKALKVAAVSWGRISGLDERLMAEINGDCEEFANGGGCHEIVHNQVRLWLCCRHGSRKSREMYTTSNTLLETRATSFAEGKYPSDVSVDALSCPLPHDMALTSKHGRRHDGKVRRSTVIQPDNPRKYQMSPTLPINTKPIPPTSA
uniref:Uncharacterized protein n=1 Tax=Salix viminalis TaxID=40686 RepID=A0A6N2M8P3_SALVM